MMHAGMQHPSVSPSIAVAPPSPGDDRIVEKFDEDKDNASMKIAVFIVYAVLITLGIGTGYLLAHKNSQNASSVSSSAAGGNNISDKTAGNSDTKAFPDTATGTLEEGGLNGEGTHKLIRDGGPSQTVYMVSSTVDLDQYTGKKVKVWGLTLAAKQAPWLMDVGKIEPAE